MELSFVREELKFLLCPFSRRLNQSTYASQCIQLLEYVHYVHHKGFSFCDSLMGATKALDVFEMLKCRVEDWLTLVVYAPVALSYWLASGFAISVKKEIPYIIITYCFFDRQVLDLWTLPIFLKEVIATCVHWSSFLIDIDYISYDDLIKDFIDLRSKQLLYSEYYTKVLVSFDVPSVKLTLFLPNELIYFDTICNYISVWVSIESSGVHKN